MQDRGRVLRLIYLLIGAEFAFSILAAIAFGFRTTDPLSFLPQTWCIGLIVCGPLARRIDHPKLGASLETVGLFYAQGLALYALLYPLTAIAASFADAKLVAADRALGFDWLAMAELSKPLIIPLAVAYFSFMVQGLILLPVLILKGFEERVWRLILAANLSLVVCVLIYPFAPAKGPFEYFGIAKDAYPFIPFGVPWSFTPVIEAIRDHGARLIDRNLMTSFVAFPSYHASAAFLLAWAAWPIRWLRWPFVVLNVLMTIAALIIGSHYLVDILAGVAISYVVSLREWDRSRNPRLGVEVSDRHAVSGSL